MKKYLRLYSLLLIIIPFLNYAQTQIGQDIDGEAEVDNSGRHIALSADGSILAISSPNNDVFGTADASGTVRIYNFSGGLWTQMGLDIDAENLFDGVSSISLSDDGSIIAIGAAGNDANGDFSGHVRFFFNDSGVWTQLSSNINGENSDDFSGSSVSLSSDGSVIAIGAPFNDGNGSDSGHVRVFQYNGATWTQLGQDINGEFSDDYSGSAVSLSDDGLTVAIGANWNDGNGNRSGHVRVFQYNGAIWTQVGQDLDGDAPFDNNGYSVKLSADGSIVATGATGGDGNGNGSGRTRVYQLNGNTWNQLGQDINGETAGDSSGYSLSLSDDGTILAIGAPNNGGNGINSGHVRVYKINQNVWTLLGTDINGESPGDRSGTSVSLSADGSSLAIGAETNSDSANSSGHVRVYDLSELLSTSEQELADFTIYPNPARNQFTIQLENPSELLNVSIYNNLGQLVLTSKHRIVNTFNIESGLYIIEVTTQNSRGIKKLLIQ